VSWSNFFYIDPSWTALLDRHGVGTLSSLLNWEEGVLVESANGSEVWRVSITDSAGVERKNFVVSFLRALFLEEVKPAESLVTWSGCVVSK